jgi:hypothetical protein
MRGLISAVLNSLLTLFGLGLGPLLTGLVSDWCRPAIGRRRTAHGARLDLGPLPVVGDPFRAGRTHTSPRACTRAGLRLSRGAAEKQAGTHSRVAIA